MSAYHSDLPAVPLGAGNRVWQCVTHMGGLCMTIAPGFPLKLIEFLSSELCLVVIYVQEETILLGNNSWQNHQHVWSTICTYFTCSAWQRVASRFYGET